MSLSICFPDTLSQKKYCQRSQNKRKKRKSKREREREQKKEKGKKNNMKDDQIDVHQHVLFINYFHTMWTCFLSLCDQLPNIPAISVVSATEHGVCMIDNAFSVCCTHSAQFAMTPSKVAEQARVRYIEFLKATRGVDVLQKFHKYLSVSDAVCFSLRQTVGFCLVGSDSTHDKSFSILRRNFRTICKLLLQSAEVRPFEDMTSADIPLLSTMFASMWIGPLSTKLLCVSFVSRLFLSVPFSVKASVQVFAILHVLITQHIFCEADFLKSIGSIALFRRRFDNCVESRTWTYEKLRHFVDEIRTLHFH